MTWAIVQPVPSDEILYAIQTPPTLGQDLERPVEVLRETRVEVIGYI